MKKITSLLLLSMTVASAAPAPDVYRVRPGDTLSDISRTKWNDIEKWKELWKLNEDHISNPNLIYPGQQLRLLSGAQVEFFESRQAPVKVASNGTPIKQPKSKLRSSEWRLLPSQSWEKFVFAKDPAIDPLGFDRRSKVQKRFFNRTPVTSTVASDRLPIQGELTASRTEFEHVFLGEQVFIRADEALQVGNIYSVTNGPEKIRSTRDGRVGFIYDLYGKVKIIGVRDGTFIGTIIEMQHPITRKNLLITEVKSIELQKPVATTAPVVASVMTGENSVEDMLGDNRTVFLDVGTNEGMQPGMIFRQYLHRDPYTGKDISTQDYLIEAELMVVDVKDQFSTAVILNGKTAIRANSQVTSLTDLTDFNKHMGLQTAIQDTGATQSADELDKLDTNQDVGEKEERDLKQLETWNKVEDIQKVETRTSRTGTALGEEPAPNDNSGQPTPQANPETAPDTLSEPPAIAPDTATEPAPAAPIESVPQISPSEVAPPSSDAVAPAGN